MAGPWEKYGGTSNDEPAPQTTARGVAKNVAAGGVEGGTGLLNLATDPFGTVIGPAIARVGGTAYDAGARVFGYPPMSPEQRADLYGLPQPGQTQLPPEQQPIATRVVNAVDQAIPGGTKVADVPANTSTEQIVRKVTGAAVAGGAGGAGSALVSAGGALAGDVAARNVPEWAAPGVELAGDVAGSKVTSHVVSPVRTVTTPERGRLVEVLDAEGVPLTAGERTGSKPLMKTEQMLGQTPGAAGGIASDVQRQQAAVNRAVASRAGLDTDTLTHDVLNTHLDTVGNEIGQLAAANNLEMTPAFVQALGTARQNLRFLDSEAARKLEARLDQLQGMITAPQGSTNAVVAGPQYRTLLTEVTRDMRNAAAGDTRTALSDFRNLLRTQMETGLSPADAARWRELNRQYANGMVIQDAMGAAGAGTAEGDISLLQLRGAINRSLGSDAYARGYGDLNDLARAGQSVLRKPPDSGSPQGIAINALMKGIPLVTGSAGGYLGGMEGFAAGVATPWAISTAMRGRVPGTDYSPGQAYLSNQLARNVDPAVSAAIIQAANAETERNRLSPRKD